MKLVNLEDGGLAIYPKMMEDWLVLQSIVTDATDQELAGQMTALMDEESCWDAMVEPDLHEAFSDQLKTVDVAVKKAMRASAVSNDVEECPVVIKNEHIQHWYGALNQSRISLENQYKLSNYEEITSLEDLPPELQFPMIRMQIYSAIQSRLLGKLFPELDRD